MMIPTVILAIESDSDRAYITIVYENYRALMFKTAWAYARERADVEDIVSEGCSLLIQHIDTVRKLEGSVLRAYIVTTVRNVAIDLYRKQKRMNAHFIHIDEEQTLLIADDIQVEKKIMLMEEISNVRQALRGLPERERVVLRLKYQKGLTDKEVAQEIGVAEASIRKYVERARKHLKAIIYEGIAQ